MTIKYNGQDLVRRVINGHDVEKVMYNGNQIWPTSAPTPGWSVTTDFTNISEIPSPWFTPRDIIVIDEGITSNSWGSQYLYLNGGIPGGYSVLKEKIWFYYYPRAQWSSLSDRNAFYTDFNNGNYGIGVAFNRGVNTKTGQINQHGSVGIEDYVIYSVESVFTSTGATRTSNLYSSSWTDSRDYSNIFGTAYRLIFTTPCVVIRRIELSAY